LAESSFSWDRIAFKRLNYCGLVGGYTLDSETELIKGDLTLSFREMKLEAIGLSEIWPFTGEGFLSRRLIVSLLVFKSRTDVAFFSSLDFSSCLLDLKFDTELLRSSLSFTSFSLSSGGIFLLAL
jgi:hypothetical protein